MPEGLFLQPIVVGQARGLPGSFSIRVDWMAMSWSQFGWLVNIVPRSFSKFRDGYTPDIDPFECARNACIEIFSQCGRTTATEPLECIFSILTAWQFCEEYEDPKRQGVCFQTDDIL